MNICKICHSKSTNTNCGYCTEPVCKKCSSSCDSEMNDWYANKKLIFPLACADCFDNIYHPLVEKFNSDLHTAKNTPIWPRTYRGKIPMLNRTNKQFQIKDCTDRKLAVLKLAFYAIEEGFNALTNVDVNYTKVRNHGYQKMLYSGSATGVMVDHSKLRDEDYFEGD